MSASAGAEVDAKGRSALHLAAFNGEREEVERLVTSGAEIEATDKEGFTPLHLASEAGRLDVVDRLTEAKADLEAKGGPSRLTPLHWAAEKGHPATVDRLVAAGAAVDAKTSQGWTPLHLAAWHGHPATVDRLVAAGAAVDAKEDISGQTPLHYAAVSGHSDAAQRLVDLGADVDAQNNAGQTPWELAQRHGRKTRMAPVLRPVYVSSLGGRSVPCGHWPERRVIELKAEAEQKLGFKICELITSSGEPLQETLTLEEAGINCRDHMTAVALVPTDLTESPDHHASGRQSGEFAAGDARGSNQEVSASQSAPQETQGGYLEALGVLGTRSKYNLQDPQQLIRLLLDANIGLMRLEYLREMIDTDRRFPRRQEADFQVTAAGLPAIVQPSELMKLEIDALGNMSIYVMDPTPLRVTVRIMSISHVWESMEHPDPHGFQLHEIVQKCPPVTSTCAVWIFYDFSSLYQYGARTDQQERDFREALAHMYTLHAHEAIKVHIVEELTPETWKRPGTTVNAFSETAGRVMPIPLDQLTVNMTPYLLRGWCQAERQWSSLRISLDNCVPMPPDLFRRKMEEQGLRFTHHDDKEVVMKLQAKVFAEKVLTTRQLMAERLDADALDVLCAALPFYADLDEIVVTGNLLPRSAAVAVAMTNARSYQMESCGLGDEDVEDIVATLLNCDKVEELRLGRNNIGHRGLQALGDLRKSKPNLYVDVLDERNLRNADFAPDMKDDAQGGILSDQRQDFEDDIRRQRGGTSSCCSCM